jgi:hypothetical protein
VQRFLEGEDEMRRLSKLAFMPAAVMLLSALTAFSAEPSSPIATLKSATVPVTVAFSDAAASRVFEAIAKSAGLTVNYQAKTDVKLSIDVKQLTLQKTLEIMALAGKFVYEVESPERLTVRSSK